MMSWKILMLGWSMARQKVSSSQCGRGMPESTWSGRALLILWMEGLQLQLAACTCKEPTAVQACTRLLRPLSCL